MPELPEVETVRVDLAARVVGRTVAQVTVRHPRSVRRQPGGAAEFVDRLTGRRLRDVHRQGKYLWLPLDDGQALVAHLGMSGQLLVGDRRTPVHPHERVRIGFRDRIRTDLRFVDQRTFGGLLVTDGGPAGPPLIAHVARDVLDPTFDEQAFGAALRRRRTGLKRALLDQTVTGGVGNIYADEALWRARLHYAKPTDSLDAAQLHRLLAGLRAVFRDALVARGTTFDGLYVDADGTAGYFARELAVYGRAGQPCPRCGTPVVREPFMNRSSYRCPRCQRPPRLRPPAGHPGARRPRAPVAG